MKKTLVIGGVLVLVLAIGGGMLAGLWVFRNIDARLLLVDQPASVIIPEPIEVSADVLDNLDIDIDTSITTTVPVDQRVSIPINETLKVMATFDSEVPIRMNVPLNDSILIDQVLDVDTVLKAELLGDTHDLPVRGKIPVKARVPVKLNIPIDQMVRLQFTAPVEARLKQALDVPLKVDIAATIPIRSQMSVPVKSALKAKVTIPEPADIVIVRSDLRLPLRTLVLQTKDGVEPEPAAAPAQP